MTKEEKKEEKKTLKIFRKHFLDRYRNAVEQYYSDIFNLKDLQLLTTNEGSVNYTLQGIIKKQEEDRKKAVYQAIINQDKPLAKELLETAQAQLLVLEEQFFKLRATSSYYQHKTKKDKPEETTLDIISGEIGQKNTELKKLQKRIEKTKIAIAQLLPIQEKEAEKKDVGRPKKEKSKLVKVQKNNEKDLEKAVELFTKENKVSASLLQRKLSIGFNKASKLIDALIEQKKVIVENGAKKLNIEHQEEKKE